MMQYLSKMGHKIFIIIINAQSNKPKIEYRNEMGLDVIVINSSFLGIKKSTGIWRHVKYFFCMPVVLDEAKKIISTHNIDYVFSYMPGTGSSYPAMKIKSKYKIPLVLDLADMYSMIKPKIIIKKSFEKADKIFVITNYLKNILLKQNIPESKIFHIPNGVDLELFNTDKYPKSEITQFRSSINAKQLIVFVGSTQDLNIVIDSAVQVIEKFPNVKYLIIGDHIHPSKSKSVWEKKVEILGLKDSFIFLGRKPKIDIPKYILSADICIDSFPDEPYYAAAHPIKILEYGACGKPIVATNVEETRNLISHGLYGLLSEADNPQSYANCIIELLSDPEKSEKMGSEFKKYVIENFNWEKIAQNISKKLE